MRSQEQPLVNQRTLDILVQVAQQSGMPPIDANKVRIMSNHNLVTNLLEVARQFITSEDHSILDFCPFVVHYFMNKYERRGQCVHALYTHIYSWAHRMESSMECRLLATMLEGHRGSRATLRSYLRIRREVTKNNPMDLLDDIFLPHEQTISIVHRLYDASKRGFICKWLNDFYVNMNYKQVNNAKLQACIFVEFLLNCQGQMHSMDHEVRITQKESRRDNPGLFASRIDKNNGFNIIRLKKDSNGRFPQTDRLQKSHTTYRKPSPKKRTLNSSQRKSPTSRSRQRVEEREQLSEMHSNQLVGRLFQVGHSSPPNNKSLNELSPANLFRTAEKSLIRLSKIDQQLDSRRENKVSPVYRHRVRDHSSEHSSHLKDLSSSNLVEKYTEDWEKMIERNENFKEKMLRKSRGIVDRKRKLLEESSFDMREEGDRHAHTEGRVYERNALPGKRVPDINELEEDPLPTHFANTFRPDELNLAKHNLPPNFSFKDSIDVDEHSDLPEIRESHGLLHKGQKYFRPV